MRTINNLIQTHLFKYSDPLVRQRGIAIFNATHKIKVVYFKNNKLKIQIQGDTWGKWYDVEIKINWDNTFTANCSCPHQDAETLCKHHVAAFLYLSQYVNDNAISVGQKYNQYNSVYTPTDRKLIVQDLLQLLTEEDQAKALQISEDTETQLERGEAHDLQATIEWQAKMFKIFFQKINTQIHSTCTCRSDFYSPMCFHKIGVLLKLIGEDGGYAFDKIVNWNKQKTKYLTQYGYTLDDDDIDQKFVFQMKDYELELLVKDKRLVKIDNLNKYLPPPKSLANYSHDFLKQQFKKYIYQLCHFISLREEDNLLVPFNLGIYEYNIEEDKYRIFDHNNLPNVEEEYTLAFYKVREYDYSYIQKILPPTTILKRDKANKDQPIDRTQIDEKGLQVLDNYLIKKFKSYLNIIKDSYLHHVFGESKLTENAPLKVSDEPVITCFNLEEDDKNYQVSFYLRIANEVLNLDEITFFYPVAIAYRSSIYALKNYQQAKLLQVFYPKPVIIIHKRTKQVFFKEILAKIFNYKDVEIENNLRIDIIKKSNQKLEQILHVREVNEYILSLEPMFNYEDICVTSSSPTVLIYSKNNQFYQLKRNHKREKDLLDFVSSSHTDLKYIDGIFYLPYNLILKNNWFIQFFEDVAKKKVLIKGLDKLNKIKYSHHYVKTDLSIKSGHDWFDCKIAIKFGDESIPLRSVQKVILSDKNHIVLASGKYGILPEEWMRKYSYLFKFGNVMRINHLQVSKVYFNFFNEDLYPNIKDKNLVEEIKYKKRELAKFNRIEETEVPEHLKNILRNYQYTGVSWLHFLDKFNWGGCLADDMGLGKTLQVLTFLKNLKKAHPTEKLVNLIVMPKTLIFNWIEEINKFIPDLTYMIYGYQERLSSISNFEKYDIIFISYGILVKDIASFLKIRFNYVVLDESQAIKNINSQRYKAVCSLKSKNKIVLSGTPVENHLLELYAQMNFINQGIFKSANFFKKQYIVPVNRGEENKIAELQRIIYPFICRRTKHQVAKDLPTKTESIIYCEMDKEQLSIYNKLKNYYQEYIGTSIEKRGVERSGMHIIEGLLKLRQVCDSPALLLNENYNNVSVKLDKLVDHIGQVPNGHKVLVFSQFLGMLELIKQKFEEIGVNYLYLDGKVKNRKNIIDSFHNDKAVRAFLISLKVGGVGLNLTVADYVYLIDPWWNPAVEQQAIDRIYRIGQTKNVFAYKMICKNSVEEKILQMQSKKNFIATNIIGSEEGFIKNLTKEDIDELFS